MNDLDPTRFTLRQVDHTREAYAQLMEELKLVKEEKSRQTVLPIPGVDGPFSFAGTLWSRPRQPLADSNKSAHSAVALCAS